MIALRLSDEILKPLDKLAQNRKVSRSFLIKKALEKYLEDIEDVEFLENELKIFDEKNESYSLSQVKKELEI